MKKIISLLFAVAVIFNISTAAYAYTYNDNDLYTVEIPESYEQVEKGKFISDDDSNFSITVTQKEDKKYCIDNLSEKKLLEEAKKEATEGSLVFAAIGEKGGMEVVSCEKVKHSSGKIAAATVYKTFMEKDGKEVSHLQKIYRFSCEENEYTFVFTPDEDKNINALDSTFDSIKITEPDAQSTKDTLMGIIGPAVIILLFLFGIFKFIRGKKR